MTQRAFTLIEILVSIAIFTVASTFMFGALFGATEVFRRGEAARQAGDEATAVIAAMQEDLARVVPFRLRDGKPAPEWGRIRAQVADAAGNCQLDLVVENPDRSQVRWADSNGDGLLDTVTGVRKRILWYVQAGADGPASDQLVREEYDLGDNGNPIPGGLRRSEIITTGVLHFGTWLEVAQAHRLAQAAADAGGPDLRWESTDPDEAVLPFRGEDFDTGTLVGTPPFYPQPDAIRITLVLTGGGRFATRGTFIAELGGDRWRISGIKALPTVTGSLLRIGNEWVRYEAFRDGVLGGVQRGQLRSDGASAPARPQTVLAGMFFSLVAPLPR